MATVFLNGALGFIMIVTFCFAIQSVEEQIIMSSAPYPFASTFANSGKKLITVENNSYKTAIILTGTAHLPSDHRAGGSGLPYSLRHSTQPMLRA